MAIEFHCPYCTATVRVGDDASGKIGRCPKCETRLRVPTIPGATPAPQTETSANPTLSPESPSSQPSLPTEVSGESAAAPSEESVAFPDLNAPKDPQTLGQLPVVPVTDDPVTSKYIKRRKKKRMNLSGMIPPLLFGGIFVAIGIWYFISTKPSYEGELTGERLNPNQTIQIEIKSSDFQIDQKIFSQIVDEVRERPSAVRSNLVNLRFSAGAKGLGISLRPGSEADLVKVPVSQLGPVELYYQEQMSELEDARFDELQQGLLSLSKDWVNAPEDEKNSTLPNYRKEVVYNSFVKGLGRICYANVDGLEYPCVHENSDGDLYFLVPIGTKEFWIQEREKIKGTPFFPSLFQVHVKVAHSKLDSAVLVPVDSENDGENDGESDGDATEEETPRPSTDEPMEPETDSKMSPNMKSDDS